MREQQKPLPTWLLAALFLVALCVGYLLAVVEGVGLRR
jgi:type VI protein secretion system component VasF